MLKDSSSAILSTIIKKNPSKTKTNSDSIRLYQVLSVEPQTNIAFAP